MELMREFERAGRRLELARAPIQSMDAEVFQMDIRRDRGRKWFRLWRGHETNLVHVADADRGHPQLVLLVRERSRTFLEPLGQFSVDRGEVRQTVARGEARIVNEIRHELIVERRTSGSLRRFLCGMDEQHLLVAQVQGGTTVRDAHRLLKPDEVREAERAGRGPMLRQGEGFFAPLNSLERPLLEMELAKAPYSCMSANRSEATAVRMRQIGSCALKATASTLGERSVIRITRRSSWRIGVASTGMPKCGRRRSVPMGFTGSTRG